MLQIGFLFVVCKYSEFEKIHSFQCANFKKSNFSWGHLVGLKTLSLNVTRMLRLKTDYYLWLDF